MGMKRDVSMIGTGLGVQGAQHRGYVRMTGRQVLGLRRTTKIVRVCQGAGVGPPREHPQHMV